MAGESSDVPVNIIWRSLVGLYDFISLVSYKIVYGLEKYQIYKDVADRDWNPWY